MSQYIFNNGVLKGRLLRIKDDWFEAQYKKAKNAAAEWMPWMVGTKDWLALTEQDIKFSIDKRSK